MPGMRLHDVVALLRDGEARQQRVAVAECSKVAIVHGLAEAHVRQTTGPRQAFEVGHPRGLGAAEAVAAALLDLCEVGGALLCVLCLRVRVRVS